MVSATGLVVSDCLRAWTANPVAKAKRPGWVIPDGTRVTWHYRSAIGHGTVRAVAKLGKDNAHTKYKIEQHDHHPGESKYVYHYGAALTRARS